MDGPTTISPTEVFAAARAWWRDAGVDHVFSDEPTEWLHRPAEPPTTEAQAGRTPLPEQPVAAPPPPPGLLRDAASLPQRLEDFAPWWLGEASLDTGGGGPRIAPRGPHAARLMVVVPAPEPTDRDILLSGSHGELFGNMLAAMGISQSEVYFAAALPSHMTMPDWSALQEAGLGTILRHHIALAAPERVMLFGQALLPLLDHDPSQKPDAVRLIAHGTGAVPALASRDLQAMLNSARERAGFWRRWLEWMDPTAQ